MPEEKIATLENLMPVTRAISGVNFVTGAIIEIRKLDDDYNEVTLYDHDDRYFVRKGMGLKISAGYKFGISKEKINERYEIVSVEQAILQNAVFSGKDAQGHIVAQMPMEQWKDIMLQKTLRIREICLKSGVDIMGAMKFTPITVGEYKRKVIEIARELEAYFE